MSKTGFLTAIAACVLVATAIVWWLIGNPESKVEPKTVNPSLLVRPYSPSVGPADAPVVIVEFFDPACGTCRDFYPLVKKLMTEHPGRIRLVMRYAPFHKGSDKVVVLLAAASKQGKFWKTLEALFEGQDDWASNHTAKADLTWKYLDKVGLQMEQMAFDVTAPEVKQAIEQDMRDASELGVAQTPEYFVNGRPLPSFGFKELQDLVSQEVAKTR